MTTWPGGSIPRGEWISTKTGIRERRISGPDEFPSDMACEAALRCLGHAGIDKGMVDLIIVACASPDQIQPAVACLVQEKLASSANQCPAFDVNSVCAGFVFALNVAQGMMLAAPSSFVTRSSSVPMLLQDPELG